MISNPEIHYRKSIRLKGYDYSKNGIYFITICTNNRENLFGKIATKNIIGNSVGAHCMCPEPEMILNQYGKIVEEEIIRTTEIRENILINEYVIMPNHIHMLIEIIDNKLDGKEGHMQCAPTVEKFGKSTSNSIPTIVKLLKASSTKRINILRDAEGLPVWQRNYHENIIRTEEIYIKVSDYIRNNPLKWEDDMYFIQI